MTIDDAIRCVDIKRRLVIPMNKARYIRRWKVGCAIAMILLCASVLVSQIWTMLDGSKKLDWPLVAILVSGIAINVLVIFRAYELERQYPDEE